MRNRPPPGSRRPKPETTTCARLRFARSWNFGPLCACYDFFAFPANPFLEVCMKKSLIAVAAIASFVAGSALAICDNCGTVTSVKAIKKEGEASGGGAVLGGVVGGV